MMSICQGGWDASVDEGSGHRGVFCRDAGTLVGAVAGSPIARRSEIA
jgi:hypothetical protein